MSFRARALSFLAFLISFVAPVAHAVSTTVVISQVYGGAGCGTAGCSTYKNDYIELFNLSSSPVSLNGWSVQYASATGSAWQVTNLTNVTLQPGQYYLVAEGAGANGVNNIPTADATGTIAMAAAAGKIALVSTTTALSGTCPTGATIVDFIGYGTTPNCSETALAPAPSTTTADVRGSSGCTDTDNNSTDFTATTPNPRNTATALAPCSGPNTPPVIVPPSDPITTVAQDAAPFTVNLSGTDDNNVFTWGATTGTGVASATVTGGQGTANVTYTVTLTAGYSGTATFTASLTDGVTTPDTQVVNITVTPAPPAAPTGLTPTAGTSHIVLNWNSVSGATSYNVKRSTSSGGETTIASPATNTYDDTTTVDGTPYFYVVSAVGPGGEGSNSSEVTATSMAAPTGLSATPGNAHVQLGWTAVTGATGYNVKRSTTSGTETTIASPGTNTYDDTTTLNGTQYFYVVTATNASGESIASSEVNATPALPGIIVISQVYGGGGSGTAGTAYTKDYVELFNRGGSTVDVSGYSLQYGSSSGNFGSSASNIFAIPATTSIPAGRYLLVALGSPGAAGAAVPSPDFTTTNLSMAAASGKVALVNNSTGLGCGATATPCTLPSANILDVAAWGASNNGEGGTTINNGVALDSTKGGIRNSAGCTDTDNNNLDFTVATTGTGLVPRNSSSPVHSCGGNAAPIITPPANPYTTVAQDAAPFAVNLTGSDDNASYTWSATIGTGVTTVIVSGGQGTANVTYTVTLTAGYSGTATFTATLSDGVNPPVNQAVNITVTPAAPATPTGLVATPGDSHVQLNWNAVSGATSYNVKRATVTGGPYSTINSPATNSFDDTTAVNGTPYFYVVSAVGPGGESGNSSEVTATPSGAPTVPAAPANLAATPGNNSVGLTWDAVATATSYNVKRSTVTGGPYTTIQSSVAATNASDNTAVNGTTYFYVVSASNAQGEGGNSSEVSATPTGIGSPTGLAGAVSSGKVALTWNVVASALSYNVKRSGTSGGPYTIVGSPASNSFDDTTVTNGTRYYYVVTAVGASDESINSAEIHAKPDVPEALGVDISQVYGNGGNAGAVYTNDFIELFNRGNSTVDLTGWSVQYASSTGSSWTPTALSGSLAPGRHYLIGQGAGAGGTTPLPTPDASGSIAMSGSAGKIALSSTSGALAGTCPGGLVDFVGYGSGANCFEGSGVAPNATGANAQVRASNGCVDTNNNASDFSSSAATPRNTASAATPCSVTAIGSATPSSVASGAGSTILKVEIPPSVPGGAIVTADLSAIGGSAAQAFADNGIGGDAVANDNIFSFSTTATGSAGVKSLPVNVNAMPTGNATTTILLTITPPLETIAAVKVDTTPADTVPDRLGQAVMVRGVVTSIDFRGGAGFEYYIQDPTGGIDIFLTTDLGPALPMGTNVEVSGTLTQFNGLTEINPTAITTLPGGTLPAVTPQTVTMSQLADTVGEPLEGRLVRVDNLTVTSGTFPAAGASGNVTVSDGTSGTVRIDSDTDIAGTTAPAGIFSIIGLVSQSDPTNPFDSGYQILPRSTADIIPRTAPTGAGAGNPPSVPPGASTLLTVSVTLGQNPPSTGVTVVVDLSSIGGSASQAFFDNGTNGDVSPGDNVFSFNATVAPATPLGPKTLGVLINDLEARSSSTSINLNIQSASAPPTPVNLVATPGNQQVSLTWDAVIGASGYNVKRATVNGGPYSTIASNHPTNSYTDTPLSNGTHYYYVVSALSGANESGDSSQADATPIAPPPSGALLKVYFVDIGQGAGTLIVGPTGKSMLVDGGPGGSATTELTSTLNTAIGPTGKIDYLVLSHYHVDHDAGLTDIINANRVSPTAIAYDNGDAANVVPPVPTNSTGTAYTAYKNALSSHGITRMTATPGTTVDLGGGARATFLAQGGLLASGGHVWVSGTDLNSSSVSTLIEFNNFDYLVSGDLTGGGQTTTAKTPDVETFVAQMAGDIDFVQLDHHGSTTANGRRFLSQLKAEGSLASIGVTNTFGHPNRETANRYLNIPVTSGNTYPGETVPPPGNGPVYYQTDASPPTDNRTSVQGYSGASAANGGHGTILLKTDGLVSYTMESLDDAGARISPLAHAYALDGQGNGLASDFPPTVIPYISPAVPLGTDVVTVTALVNDNQPITSVTLNYSINGAVQAPVTMTPTVGSEYAATIPAQANGTRVDYSVTAVANGLTTTWANGYFAGTTSIATLRSLTALAEPSYLDYTARISGLVTSGTGNFSSTNNDDYIDDGTGALNISRTIEPTSPATQPTATGSTYTVAGFINQLTGRFRLDVTPPFDGVSKPWDTGPGSFNPFSITSTGSGAVTPIARTIAQINSDPEGNEAKLVTIANCTVTSGTIPASGGVDGFLTVTDGTGSIEMKIDGDSDIPGLATPAGTFTLIGIVQQDDFLRPFTTRYDIAPRNRTDLGAAAGGPALITIAQAREDVDPTTGDSPDDYVPDRLGQQVKVRGVVTSVDFRGASGTEVYIQDPTGGVDIFNTSINTVYNIGDNLEVTGTVAQFNGLTEINPGTGTNITVLPPGTLPAPIPEVVTLSQLNNGGPGEAFEGKLIRINNVTLDAPPGTFAANTNYKISDATLSGVVDMRIDSDTDIDGTAPPAGTFSVIGVLGQFDSSAPFDSGYQLFPRIRASDFLPAVPVAASITATAGTPQTANVSTAFATQLQATVRDGSNNPIEGIGVTFTAPPTGASGTFANATATTNATTDVNGVATASVFTANTIAGPYNVVASTNALTANFSLTNYDPSATHFDVSAPANVTNGVAFNVTVTARDAANAVATGYVGTVHFTSSSTGTLPGDYTFTPGDNGTHTFSVTLTQNGSRSITATDTVTASINGTTNTTVNAAAATHFSVSAPANVTNGAAFNVTVTALDASNATVTGYTGTVHFTSSSTGTLPADYTFTGGDAGSHTFSVTLTQNGSQSVTATDTITASITGTANTTVNAAPQVATHFSVSAPANVTNGVAFNVTVTALDASNATVSGYTGTVHFTSSSTGTLPADYTFVAGDNGTHTFSVTLTQNGTQSITATDTVTASITGSANTTVNAAPQVATHFSVTAPANVTNGAAFNVTVTALDASNATVTGYTGTAHFTSSSTGTLPADYTFVAGDNGTHTFSVTLTQNGTQSITATDTVTASITGSTNTNVSASAPPPNFDANGDNVIDPADIFYLINYLFLGGPAPAGSSGPVLSGDANGDGHIDPADIFYLVNYLFGGGPAPHATNPRGATTTSIDEPMSGALRLGKATRRNDRWFVPVIVTMDPASKVPQALSLRVRFSAATDAVVHRAEGLAPIFDVSRGTSDSASYLIAFGDNAPLVLDSSRSAVIAEIEVPATQSLRLEVDPELTMLVGNHGTQKSTVANRALRVTGTSLRAVQSSPRMHELNDQQ